MKSVEAVLNYKSLSKSASVKDGQFTHHRKKKNIRAFSATELFKNRLQNLRRLLTSEDVNYTRIYPWRICLGLSY